MDIISLAREMGKEIQKDERYLSMRLAIQNTDGDSDLQDLIGKFNLKRMSIEEESKNTERDNEKMQLLQQEINAIYDKIMQNTNMIAYNNAKEGLEKLLQRVNAIITQSANGEDPETTDYVEESCSGSCSSCGGCH